MRISQTMTALMGATLFLTGITSLGNAQVAGDPCPFTAVVKAPDKMGPWSACNATTHKCNKFHQDDSCQADGSARTKCVQTGTQSPKGYSNICRSSKDIYNVTTYTCPQLGDPAHAYGAWIIKDSLPCDPYPAPVKEETAAP